MEMSGGVGQGYPQGGFNVGHGQGLQGGLELIHRPVQRPPGQAMGISEESNQNQLVPAFTQKQLSVVDPTWLFKELYDSFQDHACEQMK